MWFASVIVLLLLLPNPAEGADDFRLPDVVEPSGCRVGAVLSGEQFTTTGFSQVRTVGPNAEQVAGFWVVADDFVPDDSVAGNAPNCVADGDKIDQHDLNLMAVRVRPTTLSAQKADIERIKLVYDVNYDGLYQPLLDQVLQTKSGSDLDSGNGVVFRYGPQAPLARLGNSTGDACDISDISQQNDLHCAIALLAVVEVGPRPETGSQFGLQMWALAGDIPGAPDQQQVARAKISSGFASSRNPQASNVRMQLVGGQPGSETPIQHLSNGSGNPESAVRSLSFTGGEDGGGLKSRFRAERITPGTREAIAMAVALCDGGELANLTANILPPVAGASPTIAGGLDSIPCVTDENVDRLATGINGATLVFDGPLAKYMGTVRLYVDTQEVTAANGGTTQITPGDGKLFQPGELVQQITPQYNAETGEAIATFGGRQGQVLFTNDRTPVATPGSGTSVPMVLVWTVDIDENAPVDTAASGSVNAQQASNNAQTVNIKLGLQSFDDTAQESSGPCNEHVQAIAGLNKPDPFNCGSNYLNEGPAAGTMTVESELEVQAARRQGLALFDSNGNGLIDDEELIAALENWTSGNLSDGRFLDVVEAWTHKSPIDYPEVASFSLEGVRLSQSESTSTFAAQGRGIESVSVDIYTLDGRPIAHRAAPGRSVSWAQTTAGDQPVANGVYLYRVSAHGPNGQTAQSPVRKLVVMR